jgi:hypothetical protein
MVPAPEIVGLMEYVDQVAAAEEPQVEFAVIHVPFGRQHGKTTHVTADVVGNCQHKIPLHFLVIRPQAKAYAVPLTGIPDGSTHVFGES